METILSYCHAALFIDADVLHAMFKGASPRERTWYRERWIDLTNLPKRDAVREGFCLAINLMAAVMNTMEPPSADG